jgi:hypothetical protein
MQVPFQQRDLAGDCGLGDVEGSRSCGKGAGFYHHCQRLKTHEVEHYIRLSGNATS